MSSRSYSVNVESMFHISRTDVVAGSIPSGRERTMRPFARVSCMVASTSRRGRPGRPMRYTSSVSSLEEGSSFIMSGLVLAVLRVLVAVLSPAATRIGLM